MKGFLLDSPKLPFRPSFFFPCKHTHTHTSYIAFKKPDPVGLISTQGLHLIPWLNTLRNQDGKWDTLLGTNISHPKAVGKMSFLSHWRDMLVPWRVGWLGPQENHHQPPQPFSLLAQAEVHEATHKGVLSLQLAKLASASISNKQRTISK